MKRTRILMLAMLLLLSLAAAGAFACGGNYACDGGASSAPVKWEALVMRLDIHKLPHQTATLLAQSVKQTAKLTAQLPREFGRQMQTGTDQANVAFRAATGQTQSTFQRISAEVTALSLQLIRGAFSYFWALLSGLLR